MRGEDQEIPSRHHGSDQESGEHCFFVGYAQPRPAWSGELLGGAFALV